VSRRVQLALLAALLLMTLGGTGLVDPTRPPSRDAALQDTYDDKGVSLRVSSIVIAAERRVAVINGHAVGVGSRLAGAEVVEIAPHAVRLRGPEGEFELPLYRSPVTKKALETE
jgi:hypothetical protein